jgi:hypothetical protein
MCRAHPGAETDKESSMRAWSPVIAPSVFLLAACGAGGLSPAGLAYELPDPATLTYVAGDTADVDIDAGGENMQASTASSMTFEAAFSRSGDGVQIWLGVREFDARQSTPMGMVNADESGIDGPLVFSLDRRGNVTVESVPDVLGDATEFFQPLAIAHSVFPGLPGGPAASGDSWVDTVRFEGEQSGGNVSSLSVLTYTLVGDTVAGGRSLVRIDFEGTSEVAAQARGSMEINAAPYPLGLRVRQRGVVRLQEGG